MADPLVDLTLAEAARQIELGALSPVALTEACLTRIAQDNAALNAFVTVTADRARADAQAAERELRAGKRRGPLHGIPLCLKDLYFTAGIRTTGGSKILGDFVPEKDATAARRLFDAGAVLLGKTNTDELALGFTTNNPHYGPTKNPWDPSRVPGGSSGGSAAAIASGMSLGSLGTDTGGSIRVPSSFCGTVGLMATFGRVSKAGVVPLSYQFDHVGPMARTVEDAALLLDAVSGYDPEDPHSVRAELPPLTPTLRDGVKGLRVGVLRGHFDEVLDDEVRAALAQATAVLRELGAVLSDVELPGAARIPKYMFTLAAAEWHAYHRESFKKRKKDFGPAWRSVLKRSPAKGEEIGQAMLLVHEYQIAARRLFEQVDVLLCAGTPVPAPKIGQEVVRIGRENHELELLIGRNTVPFSAAHLPVLALPCGFSKEGLPLGMQLVARPFDEATLVKTGYAYEQAAGFWKRRPTSSTHAKVA